mgnify:CR=1 FL=1
MRQTVEPILKISDLQTHFFTKAGILRAVDGVSFEIGAGEIVGLVGESGSGKSITGFSIIGLVDSPGEIIGGSIKFKGEDLNDLSNEQMQQVRGNRIAMIFQDPMMTLNPVLRVETQMIEAIQAHDNKISREDARIRSRDALGLVGISSPDERLRAYPHQFSGGMRQRVSIAIAMLNRPDLIIADEPTTALDVSVQAQVLELLKKLCRERNASVMLITHDMGVIAETTDRVAVLYAGRLVEIGNTASLLSSPRHPYTRGLIASTPSVEHGDISTHLYQIDGSMPRLDALPTGCSFHPRCQDALPRCRLRQPEVINKSVACFLYE